MPDYSHGSTGFDQSMTSFLPQFLSDTFTQFSCIAQLLIDTLFNNNALYSMSLFYHTILLNAMLLLEAAGLFFRKDKVSSSGAL